jgi:hypothetical protein
MTGFSKRIHELLCGPAIGRALAAVAIKKALAGDHRFLDLVLRTEGKALPRFILEVEHRPPPRVIRCCIHA